jgi:dienelactone hydrolase
VPPLRALSPLLWLLAACGPAETGTLLLDPDPEATGALGERGPAGAALWDLRGLTRAQEGLRFDVVAPATAAGAVDPAGPYPAVLLLQGGLVEVASYRWLAAHLATRGYLVVSPVHPLDLALGEPGQGRAALDHVEAWAAGDGGLSGAVEPGAPAAAVGHSLGGVVAAQLWAGDPQITELVLLASFPAGGTPVEDQPGPALSVLGADDAVADPAGLRDGAARLPAGSRLAVVDGLNHYGWVKPLSEADAAKEPAPSRPPAEARADALRPLDAWLDARLLGDTAAAAALEAGAFEGVSWEAP